MSAEPVAIAPLKSERLLMIDALRGFALMGLFIVHAVEYFELYWYKMEASWVHDTVFFLFSGKMAATFALLFGVAFHMVLARYEQKGIDFRGRFSWRFIILAVAGFVHGLLYAGDILLHLALNGLLLVAICRLPNWFIGVFAAFCLLQVPTLFDFWQSFTDPNSPTRQPAFWALSGRNFEMFAHGSFSELMRYNASTAYESKWVFNIETGKGWILSGFVLLGFYLARLQFFEKCAKAQIALGWPLIVCSLLAIAFYFLKPLGASAMPEGITRWYYNEIIGSYFNLVMLSSGLLLFMWLYLNSPLQRLQNLLCACGRMSLTLYVGQSLLCVPLFYGFGLAWYDTIGQEWALVFGIGLWLLQMVFAHAWFRYFTYGPFEWCWRALTLTTTAVPFKRSTILV